MGVVVQMNDGHGMTVKWNKNDWWSSDDVML
jgi:hypothetical protein